MGEAEAEAAAAVEGTVFKGEPMKKRLVLYGNVYKQSGGKREGIGIQTLYRQKIVPLGGIL